MQYKERSIMLRRPEIITSQLLELDNIIQSTKEAIKKNYNHPETKAMEFMLEQDKMQRAELIKELEESLAFYRQHTIKLSFLTDAGAVSIEAMGKLFKTLSKFFNSTHIAINKREQPVPLYLRGTYLGSFGLLLSSETEEKLFSDIEKQFEVGFEALSLMLSQSNLDDVKEQIKQKLHKLFNLDKNSKKYSQILNAMVKVFESISQSEYSISLEWINTNKKTKKITIPREKSKLIEKMINSAFEEIEEDIVLTGKIVAIDLETKTIKLKYKEKDKNKIISISIKDSQRDMVVDKLDTTQSIKLLKITKYDTIKEQNTFSYELKGLK